MIYNDRDELSTALWDAMDGLTLEGIKTDPTVARLAALVRVYEQAIEESKQYGWVGVGCITFAENRLRSYQQLPLVRDADLSEPEHE